jgi:hypothetical protein
VAVVRCPSEKHTRLVGKVRQTCEERVGQVQNNLVLSKGRGAQRMLIKAGAVSGGKLLVGCGSQLGIICKGTHEKR